MGVAAYKSWGGLFPWGECRKLRSPILYYYIIFLLLLLISLFFILKYPR